VIEAIMLDFYGTVVHEDTALLAICDEVAASTPSFSAADLLQLWSGRFSEECACSFGPAFKAQREIVRLSLGSVLNTVGSSVNADQLVVAQFDHWRQPPMIEDARTFLSGLDLPICVVSNIDRGDLEAAFVHHGLAIDLVVTSEDERSYKPRPEMFERALRLLGVSRNSVLHVGDSWSSDVVGAIDSGIEVAWVNREGRGPPPTTTLWAEVANLNELADLLSTQRALG
jgi:2-haloacid dehalogenase